MQKLPHFLTLCLPVRRQRRLVQIERLITVLARSMGQFEKWRDHSIDSHLPFLQIYRLTFVIAQKYTRCYCNSSINFSCTKCITAFYEYGCI